MDKLRSLCSAETFYVRPLSLTKNSDFFNDSCLLYTCSKFYACLELAVLFVCIIAWETISESFYLNLLGPNMTKMSFGQPLSLSLSLSLALPPSLSLSFYLATVSPNIIILNQWILLVLKNDFIALLMVLSLTHN